jgi:hypothetical protein
MIQRPVAVGPVAGRMSQRPVAVGPVAVPLAAPVPVTLAAPVAVPLTVRSPGELAAARVWEVAF